VTWIAPFPGRLAQTPLALLVLVLAGFSGAALRAQTTEPASPTNRLDYMLVVTGEELLRGVITDSHTSFITRTLHLLGAHCVGSMIVDDRREDIRQAVQLATTRAPLVIVTGGLGPTVNDVTRPALAEATGIPLVESEDLLRAMERGFNQPRDQLRANLRRQTLVPSRGAWLGNGQGTAAGLVFETGSNVVVALPGPPRELQPMVTLALVPYLERRFGARPPGTTLTLRFVGVGQSPIDQTMRESVPVPSDVLVSSLFEGGRVDFTFALPGRSMEDSNRLRRIAAGLREKLGANIYGEGDLTLEEHVGDLLERKGGKLAVVEVATAGRLAASFESARGADRFLAGAWSAPTQGSLRKLLGLPPGQAAGEASRSGEELAGVACRIAGARWAVVVSEARTDPNGTRFAWLGFGGPGASWQTHRLALQGAGEPLQAAAVTTILDQLRRWLNTAQP